MDRIESTNTEPYVPPLQLTEGQPAPIAANGGLSYLSFAENGDAGTGEALKDALALAADDEGPNLVARIENAPPGPIETKWGPGFRTCEDCLAYINEQGIAAPEGRHRRAAGLYGLRTANLFGGAVEFAVAQPRPAGRYGADPASAGKQPEIQSVFSGRAARCAADRRVLSRPPPGQRRMHGQARPVGGASGSKLENIYDAAEVERVFYPEIEKLLLDFFPARPMRWSITTTVSTPTIPATAPRTRMRRIPACSRAIPTGCITISMTIPAGCAAGSC